ncbi:alpha/beta-hydrolase [Atractiella rhizophila]|nr:alpha/beta-hydrolase [Atractiella rhizophila]
MRPTFVARLASAASWAAPNGVKTVRLASAVYPVPSGEQKGGPIVILHGLLGSKQNWGSLSKAMSQSFKREVFALDLRNHGASVHDERHDYLSMASDVGEFMQEKGMEDVTLIGHSMGGKVAMTLTLLQHPSITRLVAADITPRVASISNDFKGYLTTMKAIEESNVTSRKQADEILQSVESDLSVRQFLLTNLNSSTPPLSFRVPLSTLIKTIDELGSFPWSTSDHDAPKWEGKTLLIRGKRSNYVKASGEAAMRSFFPNTKLVEMETGHWVHAERPKDFMQLLKEFIDE